MWRTIERLSPEPIAASRSITCTLGIVRTASAFLVSRPGWRASRPESVERRRRL
jgi:hypothetical protein